MTCVRSGYCCKKAPCPYGEGVPCVHLVPDASSTAGQYLCARYAEIVVDPQSQWSPAFGAGCSSTLFNEDRDAVVIKLRGQVSETGARRRQEGMAMKIVADSHLDHGLSPAHVAWLVERFADRSAFFVETVELPLPLPSLLCGLHGPATGDAPVPEAECHRAVRGERKGPSRLCKRALKSSRLVTVIAGPDGPEPCVLYTAYGGPSAPREPWDASLDDAGRAEAEAFWAEHALSAEAGS